MTTTIDTWTFPAFRAALAASLVCVSKDDSRPHLCQIEITDAYMNATDGHRLLRTGIREVLPKDRLRGSQERPNIRIPSTEAARILKLYSAKEADKTMPGIVVLTVGQGGKVTLTYNGNPIHTWTPSDCTFPPSDRVIPGMQREPQSPPTIGFSAAYLGDLAKIAKAIDATAVTMLGESLTGALDPVCFHIRPKYEPLTALYVLMPVRI